MLDYIFPKIDINSKKIGSFLSDFEKKKFLVHDEICYICNKNSENFLTHKFCDINVNQLVICFYYTENIKKYILAFKYYHRKEVIDEIAGVMKNFYNIYFSDLKKEETILTYIPMHWFRRYFIKWYNQSELLAKNIWNKLDIKVINISKKVKYTKPQAKIKKREKRLENLKWSFSFIWKLDQNIKNIVIIDDITTTGSTIKELAKEIKQYNKDINIFSLVLAKK